MRFVKVLTTSIGLFVQSGPCFSDWSWASERMLVSDGISMYADRFEILPTDFCALFVNSRIRRKKSDPPPFCNFLPCLPEPSRKVYIPVFQGAAARNVLIFCEYTF